jgi:hypothetical protein
LRPAGGDEDGDLALRWWARDGLADGVVAARERDGLAAQERDDDLERFLKAADAIVG